MYNFFKVFTIFDTNKDVTRKDIGCEENKKGLFLSAFSYNRKRGDFKSNKVKLFRRIETSLTLPRRYPRHYKVDSSSEETVYESGEEVEASGLSKADADKLIERLEILIPETKAGLDGLYDEMLDKSKQLLSMNNMNQEQLHNFFYNYGKKTMVEKQQLLAEEVFCPRITKFRREREIPLYKDETWSASSIEKSSLSKYKNNYKFNFIVIDIFTEYAWVIQSMNISGLSITKGFKSILSEVPQSGSEGRKPVKLWVDRGSEFYKKFRIFTKRI